MTCLARGSIYYEAGPSVALACTGSRVVVVGASMSQYLIDQVSAILEC